MSQIYSSQLKQDNQFFDTIKRYTQRLNEQKNLSLTYLQAINKLTSQMTRKDELIQRLQRQNSILRQKLSLCQQVMTRSRVLINGSNKNNFIREENIPCTGSLINLPNSYHLKNSIIKINYVNNANQYVSNLGNQKILNVSNHLSETRIQNNNNLSNMKNMRMSSLISKQKFTESILETRNEIQLLNEFDRQEYEKIQNKIRNGKQSLIIGQIVPKSQNTDKIRKFQNNYAINQNPSFLYQNQKLFPIFQDFIVIKPTQNTASTPQNINQLKLLFRIENSQTIKKGNKIFQSISTYLCHNSGSSWIPQEYKTQINTNNSNLPSSQNPSQQSIQIPSLQNIFIYLSNSEQTLMPTQNNLKSKNTKISEIYLQFNPSLYFYGICYKSHTLQYINGKLFQIPLLYCFITRYPFLTYWRQFLQIIVERLSIKNEKQMDKFRKELKEMKDRSLDPMMGLFSKHQRSNQDHQNYKSQFQFEVLEVKFKWKKIRLCSNNPSKISSNQLFNLNSNTPTSFYNNFSNNQRHRSLTSNTPTLRLQNPKSQTLLFTKNTSQLKTFMPELLLQQLSSIFSSYSIQLIVDVLLLFLLQIPIAIISKNQSLLQKFMIYFVYIIKPLKYPFPIIFNLPLNMSVVLQSPFPSFLGITDPKVIEAYMFERTVFDLDQKIAKSWPNIQFYNNSRDCVMKWVNSKLQKQGDEIMRLQRINDLVGILISSSKYYPEELKELRTYRKYFKKTQMWHMYNYSREQRKKSSELRSP